MTIPLLEPALEELLREVASDPRSSLLRVDRPSLLKGPFDHDPMVRESFTGLRSAERELLRVYRQELGHALRECCFDLVYRREDRQIFLFPDFGNTRPEEFRSFSDAANDSNRLANLHPHQEMKRLIAYATGTRSHMALAILACRIAPSTRSYLCLSDSYEVSLKPTLERRAISHASRLTSTRIQQAHVLSYIGYVHAANERHEQSMSAFRGAYESGGKWPNEVLSWLCQAIQAKSSMELDAADYCLRDAGLADSTVKHWTDDRKLQRSLGGWSARDGSRRFLNKHLPRCSEQASYVAHTLFIS